MDFIIEFLMSLVFEGSIEIAKSKKISKWIRYPLIFIISLFFISIIGLIGVLGFLFIYKNTDIKDILVGIFFIIIDIIMILGLIRKIILQYKNYKD